MTNPIEPVTIPFAYGGEMTVRPRYGECVCLEQDASIVIVPNAALPALIAALQAALPDGGWLPIDENTPKSTLLKVWVEGYEEHSGVMWRRCGIVIAAIHDGKMAKHHMEAAVDRIIGDKEYRDSVHASWHLEATRYQPLPPPPTLSKGDGS